MLSYLRAVWNESAMAASLAACGLLAVLAIPTSPPILDWLMLSSLAIAVWVLLSTLGARQVKQLRLLPRFIMGATLLRLAVDLTATRSILTNSEGPWRAGRILPGIAHAMGGDNQVAGLGMAAILTIVVLLGALASHRLALTASRFSGEFLYPGLQGVDADLHSGLIDIDTARSKRLTLERRGSFYSSLPGFSYLGCYDAVANLLILPATLLGGVVLGMRYHGLSAQDSLDACALLTVGKSFISSLSGLALVAASGLLAVKSRKLESDLWGESERMLAPVPAIRLLAVGLLTLAGMTLGHPNSLVAAGLGSLAVLTYLAGLRCQSLLRPRAPVVEPPVPKKKPESVVYLMQIDPLSLEVGRGLLCLVDPNRGAPLLERVTSIRRHIAMELGVVVPGIRFRDNLQLQPKEYVIKLRDIEVARGALEIDRFLCIGKPERLEAFDCPQTQDPTYGMPAAWIPKDQQKRAEELGCLVFDPVSVVATQVTEVARAHAAELVGLQECQALIDTFKKTHPAVVRLAMTSEDSLLTVQEVLQRLLRERVSIRDLEAILTSMARKQATTDEVEELAEAARLALRRSLVLEYATPGGLIPAIVLDSALESQLEERLEKDEEGSWLNLDPKLAADLMAALGKSLDTLLEDGKTPLVLARPSLRAAFRRFGCQVYRHMVVLSWDEVAHPVKVETRGMLSLV